ncbi:JAB domain-containing protein [Tepidiphilus succinatimandens]|uniref:JAB domain-containing protein n=1 Tax=Tepidiphilus succinatimandens TaxID=224436 RepID=UPI00112F2DC7|nr:DNA repair protein RadC [Tepidiphilus succinatimandens]
MNQIMSNTDLLATLVGRETAKLLAAKPLAELFGFTRPRQPQLCESVAPYTVHPALAAAKELFVRCIQERMQEEDLCFSSPETTKTFLCSKIGHLEHESFWCLWLDSQNRLIEAGELFRGTVNQASVYPREVVKKALAVNAAAVIFAHNHPSGSLEPSRADEVMTNTLKSALALVDVRVLDHFVVAGTQATSFAATGRL